MGQAKASQGQGGSPGAAPQPASLNPNLPGFMQSTGNAYGMGGQFSFGNGGAGSFGTAGMPGYGFQGGIGSAYGSGAAPAFGNGGGQSYGLSGGAMYSPGLTPQQAYATGSQMPALGNPPTQQQQGVR